MAASRSSVTASFRLGITGSSLLNSRPAVASPVNWTAAARIPNNGRAFSQTHSASSRGSIARSMQHLGRKSTPRSPIAEVADANSSSFKNGAAFNMLIPLTFVRPPLSKFPREPKLFFGFLWAWIATKLTDARTTFLFKLGTKPGWAKRAVWKRNMSAIVPEAKELHRAMSEGLASGNRVVLNKICIAPLARRLVSIVGARPRGRRYSWELLRYNSPRPQVVSHKIMVITDPAAPTGNIVLRQAVVRIASRQRIVEYDDTPAGPREVPGSEKEMDLVENVVLSTFIDTDTHKQLDWRIFGTIPDQTPENFEKEKKMMADVEREELDKFKV